MGELEYILVGLTHLKYLTLELCGEADLIDAHQLEALTTGLHSFSFRFHMSHEIRVTDLSLFLESYWTEYKHWYIASYGRCVFSLSHYSLDHTILPEQERLYSTASNINLICSQATKLTLNTDISARERRFPRVTALELTCSISSTTIAAMIDMNRLVHLQITSLDLLLPYLPLKSSLPQLTKLEVDLPVTEETAILFRGQQLKQIRDLRIRVPHQYDEYITEELLRVFPSVQNLTYVSNVLTAEVMMRVVSCLTHLRNALFYSGSSFMRREKRLCTDPDRFIQESGRFNGKQISCRVFCVPHTLIPYEISWKIDQHTPIPRSIHPENSAGIDSFDPTQTLKPFRLKDWLPKRGYYWYLCKYIVTCDGRLGFVLEEYLELCVVTVISVLGFYFIRSTLPRLREIFLWVSRSVIMIFMNRIQRRLCKYVRGYKYFLVRVCFYCAMCFVSLVEIHLTLLSLR